jgi:hypothetical protein
MTDDMSFERYRAYATTDEQWAKFVAYKQHGTYVAAGLAMDCDESRIRKVVKLVLKRAAQAGYAPAFDIDHELPEGLRLKGTSIRYDGSGNVDQYWNKSGLAGREPEEGVQLADPKRIKKVSTLFDQQGKITQQWVSEEPEAQQREELWRLFADELKADMPRYEPLMPPVMRPMDRLACYPIGDHHNGMLAWKKETGSDSYDLEIAEQYLASAMEYLIKSIPPCEHALIAGLGDFLHYDSTAPVTPTSHNQLDSDGRYPKMIRVAVRSIRRAINLALRQHQHVHVIMEIGNHDLFSTIFLLELLANVYENEPRVTIDTSPQHYHYFEFGKVLIGTHHGHGSKMPDLPLIMAADQPEAWGRTKHRYIWTGHIHNRTAYDKIGCSVESFRILAPVDAWAAQKGYRAIRDMKAIVIDREQGELQRNTVNPRMFG